LLLRLRREPSSFNQQTEVPSHVHVKHACVASQPTGWIAFTDHDLLSLMAMVPLYSQAFRASQPEYSYLSPSLMQSIGVPPAISRSFVCSTVLHHDFSAPHWLLLCFHTEGCLLLLTLFWTNFLLDDCPFNPGGSLESLPQRGITLDLSLVRSFNPSRFVPGHIPYFNNSFVIYSSVLSLFLTDRIISHRSSDQYLFFQSARSLPV
jgi:hypothetical protein